ncbi:uncharacterized protein V6R79_010717 [Siganus canaliculatus]
MFPLCTIGVLCLASMSQAAPLTCEDLVQPLNHLDPHHLEGRWALTAGSVSDSPQQDWFKHKSSITVDFSSTNGTSISITFSMRSVNECYNSSFDIFLEGSTFTFADHINTSFTRTSCPDCILMSFDVMSGRQQHFYLFSRRRQVEENELEEFRAQVECLKMPPLAMMDPHTELCPEEAAEKVEGQNHGRRR